MPDFTSLLGGMSFTESPRWRDGRLYFSDFYTHRVMAVAVGGPSHDASETGAVKTIAYVPGVPGGIGWLPDGRMLIASKHERRVLLRETDGSLEVHADLWDLAPWHVNEMVVDRAGRAWVGNYGFDLDGGAPNCTTGLICVEPDGTAKVVVDGLGFPNGMAFTEDGRTLIVAETTMNRLSAFDVDGGVLSNHRIWAAFGDPPSTTDVAQIFHNAEVVPDGICLDAEGAVWVADVLHCRLIRVAEGGRILEELPTNGVPVFAVMLGGADGCTLFACVAPELTEAAASANHRAAIWMTRVAVPGLGCRGALGSIK